MAEKDETTDNGKKIHPSKKRVVSPQAGADNADKIPETEQPANETTDQQLAAETPAAETPPAETEYQPVIEAEPEIKSDAELLNIKNESTDYSPLSQDRVQRDYAEKDTSNQPVVERVAEEEIKNSPTGSGGAAQPTGDGKKTSTTTTPPTGNPDTANLTPTEQRESSTMLVDALLGGYRQLWGGVAWMVTVGDNQVMQWIMEGKLDEDMTIPFGSNGEQMRVQAFFKEFDDAVTEAGEIPENHFEPVRESMIREFTRRGWGISDMQNIMQFFARDAVQRSGNFYALYKQRVMNTNQLFELWKQQKEILDQQAELLKKDTPPAA